MLIIFLKKMPFLTNVLSLYWIKTVRNLQYMKHLTDKRDKQVVRVKFVNLN